MQNQKCKEFIETEMGSSQGAEQFLNSL